jgi:heme-degrading monooxygenase HmoA
VIAHVVEFNAPAEVLETTGMEGFRDRVLPVLESQPGFVGNLLLMSRDPGKMLGITLWENEEAGRKAGERLAQEIRIGVDQMSAEAPEPLLYEVLDKR